MPYKRKDSPYWWVSVPDRRGKRIRRSTGTTDRKEAAAIEAKWKAELYQQQTWGKQPDVTFEEVMLNYLKSRPADQQDHARNADLSRTKILQGYFAGQVMNQLSAREIITYRKDRQKTVSDSTINRELAQLSAAITAWNIDNESDLPNPVKGRKLRQPEGRIRWISRAEAAQLISAARASEKAPHLAPFITLALHTGMRKNELLGLEWSRVDLQANLIFLEAKHTKTKRRRTIPINSIARSALIEQTRHRAKHCPASPWVFSTTSGDRLGDLKRSFATACRRAGIKDFRIHDMRHTCAAWLVTAGVPLPEVRDLLGHRSITTTEKYAHLSPDNVRAAVETLEEKRR